MTILDRVVLLLTGLIAVYLLWQFARWFKRDHKRHNIYYMIAFSVLLTAGLLLIAFTYTALASPLVVIVSVLIPAGLAMGLISEFFPDFEKSGSAFFIVGLAAIALTRFTGPDWLATVILIIVHAFCGVIILGMPVWMAVQGRALRGFIWVAVGGLLIDTGGMALAFLKSGGQLLFFSEAVVLAILAPLLLLMTLSFALGFTRQKLEA